MVSGGVTAVIHGLNLVFRLSDLLLESFHSTSITAAICYDIVQVYYELIGQCQQFVYLFILLSLCC